MVKYREVHTGKYKLCVGDDRGRLRIRTLKNHRESGYCLPPATHFEHGFGPSAIRRAQSGVGWDGSNRELCNRKGNLPRLPHSPDDYIAERSGATPSSRLVLGLPTA